MEIIFISNTNIFQTLCIGNELQTRMQYYTIRALCDIYKIHQEFYQYNVVYVANKFHFTSKYNYKSILPTTIYFALHQFHTNQNEKQIAGRYYNVLRICFIQTLYSTEYGSTRYAL